MIIFTTSRAVLGTGLVSAGATVGFAIGEKLINFAKQILNNKGLN